MLMYQRQLMKQDLSKSVVDEGNAAGPQKGSFSTEELRALFKVGCIKHKRAACFVKVASSTKELRAQLVKVW